MAEHNISVLLLPDALCHGCIPLARHSRALIWAALLPGKSIFGLSQESRAWPRLHAKHPHFLLLTASLLYHKLSHLIFFSTHKCCSHWTPTLPRATRPPGSNPSPKTLAFCSLHKTHRGFFKPISPCHQTVVSLNRKKKKSSAFYDLGFPFHTSWLSQAAQGPPGGGEQHPSCLPSPSSQPGGTCPELLIANICPGGARCLSMRWAE